MSTVAKDRLAAVTAVHDVIDSFAESFADETAQTPARHNRKPTNGRTVQ